MTRISMKTINQLNEKDLKSKIQESKSELSKLKVDAAKGTLRKESGKLKPIRHDIARMLTRLTEMKKEKWLLQITLQLMNSLGYTLKLLNQLTHK